MSDNAIDRLKEMVNKPFLYQNEEIVILNYCDGTGDDGDVYKRQYFDGCQSSSIY